MKALEDFHPIVLFTYFVVTIGFTMFYTEPILLLISFTGAFTLILLVNRKAGFAMLKWLLPFTIIAALVNPFITHDGEIILLYINEQPITLEAIVYGFAIAVMLLAVILWFACLNKLLTSDKFIYLFGKISPALALLITLTLRLTPNFIHQIKRISNAQKGIGMDPSTGSLMQRIKAALHILSILISWALENSIETADSMKARGYGLKGRTTFSLFKFERSDAYALTIILLLFAAQLMSSYFGWTQFAYYPTFSSLSMSGETFFTWFTYSLLVALPIFIEIQEALKWRSLKSSN